MENNQPIKRKRTFMWVNIRWSVYSGLSFLTALSIIVPSLTYQCSAIVFIYVVYLFFSTFIDYTKAESNTHNIGKSIRMALAVNGMEIAYFVLAMIVGFVVGIGV